MVKMQARYEGPGAGKYCCYNRRSSEYVNFMQIVVSDKDNRRVVVPVVFDLEHFNRTALKPICTLFIS